MKHIPSIGHSGTSLLLLALAALALMLLPACTMQPQQAASTPTAQPASQHTVVIDGTDWLSRTIDVVTGDSIIWINQTDQVQMLQISTRVAMQRDPGTPAQDDGDGDRIPPGESLTISFLEAGPVAMRITAQETAEAPPAEQAPPDPAAATPIPVPPAGSNAPPPADPSQGWYIAPYGTPDGDGSMERPWDMETALLKADAEHGDTIWVRGGTYRGTFVSWISGSADAPIIIRAYPGERVVLDSGVGRNRSTITVMGQHIWFWGLEFTNSEAVRVAQADGSSPEDIEFGGGMNIGSSGAEEAGIGVRLINSIMHDVGSGVGMWRHAADAEVYGCIIYNNGWQGPDRGHGHGIYAQNQVGTKRIVDNIVFNHFGYGVHVYGSDDAALDGFHVEGNILFNNGSLGRYKNEPGAAPQPNILIGGGTPASRAVVTNNMTYSSFDFRENIELDYADTANRDIIVTNNYAVGGSPVLALGNWDEAQVTGNTLYGRGTSTLVNMPLPETRNPAAYTWNNNTYYSPQGAPFRFREEELALAGWQQTTGLDSDSRLAAPRPKDVAVFVRPNQYEAGRAHIAVYNWTEQEAVTLDLSALLAPGARYEIHNVQELFGEPVVSGTYEGAPVQLPLNAVAPPEIIGGWVETPPTTGPEFNAYLLTSAP
jgi:hypothetical protein